MAVIGKGLRDIILKRSKRKCERCLATIPKNNSGGKTHGSMHHRKPRRMGGPDWVSNLVHLCTECHIWVHKNEPDAANDGWIVWTDPEFTPLKRHGKSWVLLVPDGTLEYVSASEARSLLYHLEAIA